MMEANSKALQLAKQRCRRAEGIVPVLRQEKINNKKTPHKIVSEPEGSQRGRIPSYSQRDWLLQHLSDNLTMVQEELF